MDTEAARFTQLLSAFRKEKTPGRRWGHHGAARRTPLDYRRPPSTVHPRIPPENANALGEGSAMTDETTIAEWTINNRRERLRVSIEQFKGVYLINVRKWFEAEGGLLRPGKAGIALNVKHLPQLAEAMTKALALASERDLISRQDRPPTRSQGQP